MKKKFLALCLSTVMVTGVFAGCAKKTVENVTPPPAQEETVTGSEFESGKVQDLYTAIKDTYGEDYIPDSQFEKADVESKFGIDMANVKDFLVEMPMISTNVDTLVIVESEPDKIEAVVKNLEDYRTALVADTMQYPMNISRINASKVYSKGNYAFFVLLGKTDMDIEDEKEQLAFAEAENQKAIDAIDATFAK